MPKERTINPAQAQRKADKAKAIKKGTLCPLLSSFDPNLPLLPTTIAQLTPLIL
jgi:hypothetical protein